MKKSRKIILRITTIFVLTTVIFLYRHFSFEGKKDSLVNALESYKSTHQGYPKELNELGINLPEELHYNIDSAGQNCWISYTQGIMGVNTVTYNSKTKKWEKQFNY